MDIMQPALEQQVSHYFDETESATPCRLHRNRRSCVLPQLNEAIIDFEAKLERIVETDDREVVKRWVEELRGSFDVLDAIICTQRQRVHEKLFREIADQNTSELKHIRELKDADEQIEEMMDCVKSQLIVFSVHSSSEVEARIEGQGSEDEPTQDVIDRCTDLIDGIREQEDLVAAWFAEAFARGEQESQIGTI